MNTPEEDRQLKSDARARSIILGLRNEIGELHTKNKELELTKLVLNAKVVELDQALYRAHQAMNILQDQQEKENETL